METKKNKPIGIFDSGIGGFTVAKTIRQLLPHESLLYFGDTAHLPYGDKSPEAIQGYALKIGAFLIKQGAKMIVIACNSASAVAYEAMHKKFHKQVPIISMVEPVVNFIVQQRYKKVGIIGTKATITSNVHAAKIHAQSYTVNISTLATPLLVPMIEEGFFNNNISQTIINSYLSNKKLKGINALVLACTHYPLIRKQIEKYYKQTVSIIDPAEIVAQQVKEVLTVKKIMAEPKIVVDKFYVSDYTKGFVESTKNFFGETVPLKKIDL